MHITTSSTSKLRWVDGQMLHKPTIQIIPLVCCWFEPNIAFLYTCFVLAINTIEVLEEDVQDPVRGRKRRASTKKRAKYIDSDSDSDDSGGGGGGGSDDEFKVDEDGKFSIAMSYTSHTFLDLTTWLIKPRDAAVFIYKIRLSTY